ncbi:MAG TPA: hypothetical protein VHA14_10445 [Bryobacteraceae bacterium]|nr:hypothetical protein [Bryobacteraceae bacterium]
MLAFLAISLHADDKRPVTWEGLCNVSQDHSLQVTTSAGDNFEGYCVSVNANEVAVRSNGNIVRIARDHVSKIMMTPRRHQLASLARGVHEGLSFGVHATFSPAAPLGIAAIPATLAWGAVALPFCAIGDLMKPRGGPTELIIFKPR